LFFFFALHNDVNKIAVHSFSSARGRPSWREVTMQMQMQRWRNESFIDVVNLILGAWLFLTPWIFGFAGGAAGWSAWILGGVIALVAIAALTAFAEWEEWINLLLGLCVIAAPWTLAFEANGSALRNHVIVGVVVAALAALELWLVHGKPPHVAA
jgi:SPW repeat